MIDKQTEEEWNEGLEDLINDIRSNPSTDSVHIHEYLRKTVASSRTQWVKEVRTEIKQHL